MTLMTLLEQTEFALTKLARLQQLRDDLDVHIGLEQIKRGAYVRRKRRSPYS
jgi:hypothetical protein